MVSTRSRTNRLAADVSTRSATDSTPPLVKKNPSRTTRLLGPNTTSAPTKTFHPQASKHFRRRRRHPRSPATELAALEVSPRVHLGVQRSPIIGVQKSSKNLSCSPDLRTIVIVRACHGRSVYPRPKLFDVNLSTWRGHNPLLFTQLPEEPFFSAARSVVVAKR